MDTPDPFSSRTSPFHHALLRVLQYAHVGGAEIGECLETARGVPEGDYEAWWTAWRRTAERARGRADLSRVKGHSVSASQAYLCAAHYYRIAEFFLREDLDDPRLVDTADRVRETFREAARHLPRPVESVEIPYEGVSLPGYLFLADDTGLPRPTVLAFGGYDDFIEETYAAGGAFLLDRGFNVLAVEGPGQGHVLRRLRLPFRPDWEAVVGPVLDYAVTRLEVDPDFLVLFGRGFGGYLVGRAMIDERRLHAWVANPAHFDPGMTALDLLPAAQRTDWDLGRCGEVDSYFEDLFRRRPGMRWYVRSRMAAHGCGLPSAYLAEIRSYSLRSSASRIRGHALLCVAAGEGRHVGDAQELYEALKGPKEFVEFTPEEGASAEGAPPLQFAQRVLDRISDVLESKRD